MLSSQVIFDTEEVKKCIDMLGDGKVDRELYFDALKQKKINEFANKTNDDFDKLIEQICEGIDNANSLVQLKRIGIALGKLNAISKRLYYSETEFLDYI